jgi:hypothetical protein
LLKANKPVYKQTVAQILLNSMKSTSDPHILNKWGAKDFTSSGNYLKFSVCGSKFSGDVIVTFNTTNNTYFITLEKKFKGKRKIDKKVLNINIDDIVNVLDSNIMGDEHETTELYE